MQNSVKQETRKQDFQSSIFPFFLCLGSTLASLARQEQTKVTKFHFDAKRLPNLLPKLKLSISENSKYTYLKKKILIALNRLYSFIYKSKNLYY